jgi:hypothetical protein
VKTIKVEQHRHGLVLVRGAENELLSASDLVTLSWEIETALDQIAEFGSQESMLAELYLEDAIKIVSESQIVFPKEDMVTFDNRPGICLAIRSEDTMPAGVKVCSKENLSTNKNSSCSEKSLAVEAEVFVQTQESQLLLARLHYLLQKQVVEGIGSVRVRLIVFSALSF